MSSATREQKRLLYEQLIGQQLAGKFTITGLLGFGGMGAVYEAVQSPMDRKVALKVIPSYDPTAAARFEREAYTVSKLSHPNTVTVFDFGHTQDGQLFLSMEYLEGRTLSDLIKKEGPLHPTRAIHIAEQICRSLGEAHRHGIMHRDVKPDNILLIRVDQDPDYVKVLDFGIAKAIQGEDDVNLTAEGRIVGTPRYMSPEQILALHVDHRSDIYSLGCILFEMICGSPPFEQQSTAALMMSHAQKMPPHFSERLQAEHLHQMPPNLEHIVHRTMAKSAEARHRDTDELRQELSYALHQFQSGAVAVQHPGQHQTSQRSGHLTGPVHQTSPPAASSFEHHTGDFSHQTGNFAHHYPHAQTSPPSGVLAPPHLHHTSEEPSLGRDLPHAQRSPRAPLYAALLALFLLFLGLGAYVFMSDDPAPLEAPSAMTQEESTGQADEDEDEASAGAQDVQDAPLIMTRIVTDPPGAAVFDNGERLGVTPFELELKALDEPTSFRLELTGYEAGMVYVDPTRPEAVYTKALGKQSAPAEKKRASSEKKRPHRRRNSTPNKNKTKPVDVSPVETTLPPKEERATSAPAPAVKPKVKKLGSDEPRSPKVKRLE